MHYTTDTYIALSIPIDSNLLFSNLLIFLGVHIQHNKGEGKLHLKKYTSPAKAREDTATVMT